MKVLLHSVVANTVHVLLLLTTTSGTFVVKKFVDVTTNDGTLRGQIKYNDYAESHYYSFEGVPYARPPVGALRFKEPLPVEPWMGVKEVTNSDIMCPQGNQHPNETEDCLTLNVYVPKKSSKHPRAVFVYIFGGGFMDGSISSRTTGPDYLLANNVICITLNYRLGLLGFLKLNDPRLGVHGNNGIRDQIMALKWVQRNIQHFGGNRDQVVIGGCSSGAVAVHALILSPAAKGLFHGAIMESGNLLYHLRHKSALDIARGHDPSIRTEAEAFELFNRSSTGTLYEMAVRFSFKGYETVGIELEERESPNPVLPKCITRIVQEKTYSDVPVLIGYNSNEAIEYRPFFGVDGFLSNLTRDFMPGVFWGTCYKSSSEASEDFLRYYYDELRDMPQVMQFCAFIMDFIFFIPTVDVLHMHFRKTESPVYVYRFDMDTHLNFIKNRENIRDMKGASHADELGYLFKMDVSPSFEKDTTDEDFALKIFQTLWTNFIKTANPNKPKKVAVLTDADRWRPWNKKSKFIQHLNIGMKLKMVADVPERKRVEMWHRSRNNTRFQCCKTRVGSNKS